MRTHTTRIPRGLDERPTRRIIASAPITIAVACYGDGDGGERQTGGVIRARE
jgi:hypothetical protein